MPKNFFAKKKNSQKNNFLATEQILAKKYFFAKKRIFAKKIFFHQKKFVAKNIILPKKKFQQKIIAKKISTIEIFRQNFFPQIFLSQTRIFLPKTKKFPKKNFTK